MVTTRCPQHIAADPKREDVCPRCGGLIPSDDTADVLLDTLTQLAQFGLDAKADTLLERSDGGR